jgi:ABC-type proline/glycine betaine transport system ATPase subunit
MVMEKGRIVEFDTPKELLSKRSSFSRFVDETGEQAAKFLRDVAFGNCGIYEIPQAVSQSTMKHVRRASDMKKEKMFKKMIKENSRLMITNNTAVKEANHLQESYNIINFLSNSPRSSRRISQKL